MMVSFGESSNNGMHVLFQESEPSQHRLPENDDPNYPCMIIVAPKKRYPKRVLPGQDVDDISLIFPAAVPSWACSIPKTMISIHLGR